MAYRKKVKYRKDILPYTMQIFLKSLRCRKKIIKDEDIYSLRAGKFGFPEWIKEGALYSFGGFREAEINELVAVKKSDFRRLAKYLNVDIIHLINTYFLTSTLAVSLDKNDENKIYEVKDVVIGIKFKNVNWYIESKGIKFLILEKRRFYNLEYSFKEKI